MLNNDILQALKSYAANMQNKVTLVLQTGEHEKRNELVEFLNQFTSVSENLVFEQRDTSDLGAKQQLRSPMSFQLETDAEVTGSIFSGIPSGHEFNSLVLAVLWHSGTELKLDSSLQTMIERINTPMHFDIYVSLSCHNCPDVVQALNQFAVLNPLISAEMIDGGIFPELIEENDIQGVPSVYTQHCDCCRRRIDATRCYYHWWRSGRRSSRYLRGT